MNRKSLFVLAVAFFIIPETFAQLGNFDVFPLTPGIHFSYHYFYWETIYNVTSLEFEIVDSGRVEYLVQDSIHLGDTAIVWNVIQTEDLWHYSYGYFTDTTYRSVKNSNVTLVESLSGQHELRCSSLVWQFPVDFHTSTPVSVYRYSDTASLLIVIPKIYPSSPDSLSFAEGRGFQYGYFYHSFGATMYTHYTLRMEQEGMPTAVNEQPSTPTGENWCQNFPNPFNASTTIAYSLSFNGIVELQIFDLLGRHTVTLNLGHHQPGKYSRVLDFQNLPSGVYFYQIHARGITMTGRFVLAK